MRATIRLWSQWRIYGVFAGIFFLFVGLSGVQANPTGGQVVSGSAKITTVPGTVTITQTTSTASINWNDFSIASGELTHFQVPSSTSSTLNRVTGGNISTIYGTLQSNGLLYLINPSGIVVGPSGKVDAGGFLASTLNFSDTQFNQQGDLNLTGSSSAAINNQGTIHASTGDVYLVASQVSNSGTIRAPNGTVGLAAGNSVLLQKAGDQHLFVQVAGTASAKATGVTNSGSIRAAAAELKAAGGNAYALAINNTGNVAATGIATINGQVYLTADGADISNSGTISAKQANGSGGKVVVNAHHAVATTKGTALNSGTISAAGTAPGAVGGTVELLGDRVGVTDNGVVDVSGSAGGGTALVGGDEHGANAAVPDADQTYLGPDATIEADALTVGTGGKVILWGNETNQVYGQISAMGGPKGGDGGFLETSAAVLQVLTAPDLSAPMGKGGTWLLDPSDVTISDAAANSGYAGAPGAPTNSPFQLTTTTGTVTISQATLQTALEQNSFVSIDASTGSGAPDAGTITWTQPGGTAFDISNINGSYLYLNAPNQLTMSGVTIKSASGGGSLSLELNDSGNFAGVVSVTGGNINLNGGGLYAEGSSVTLGGTITAGEISAYSPQINVTNATLTAAGGSYPFFSLGNTSAGQISITNSTLNLTGASGYVGSDSGQASQVSLVGSTINVTQGAGQDFNIQASSATAGVPGVSITGGSSITTDSADIYIQGTGVVAASSDATGVLISDSTLTVGSSATPGTGSLEIDGSSDTGSTSLSPNATFANNSYGVQINGSTLTNYSTNSMKVDGIAYAANNLSSTGVFLEGGTVIQTFNGNAKIRAAVDPESFADSSGEANQVYGLETTFTQIEATGASAQVDLGASNRNTVASDNGVASTEVLNIGLELLDHTSITASGSNNVVSFPIHMDGESGPAQASTGNTLQTESVGVWLNGGASGATISNSGQGVTVISGLADSRMGATTGPLVDSVGVVIGSASHASDSVTSSGGGTIGIAGIGGTISAGSNSTFNGSVGGVEIQDCSVTTTTGDIAITAAGGTVSGSVPGGATVNNFGLELQSGTLQTNTTLTGANQIPNGGSIPPLILIYATDSTVVSNPTNFQLGSATNYAVDEDTNSKLITGDLVMGNFYDLYTTYGTASAVTAAANAVASYNSAILNTSGFTLKNGTETITGFTFNPAGIVDLTSMQNQVTNLTGALVGTGGFNLDDSVNLTVSSIGDTTNANYGQINEPGVGPVSITMAANANLTLNSTSPITNAASSAPASGAVIATTGLGSTITLTTSGTGQLINDAGGSALSVAGGANYILYAASPADVTLDGIAAAQMLYSTLPNGATGTTANTIAFASAPPTAQYTLDGTAYTDSGVTESKGTTIDLVFDGTLLGSTTTDAMNGSFTFAIGGASGVGQGADVNSGVLLIDMADKGTTFYQAASPATTISGVDIWGNTLRVTANTVSNAKLGQVAGSPAFAGVNYAVTGTSLATNTGINLLILPNSSYTLDGSITASGTLTTGANASLSTSSTGTVTLAGTSIALGGPLISAGTVNLSSSGTITDSGPVNVGGFILQGGNWNQVVGQNGLTSLPAFSDSGDFELQGDSTFLRAAGIDGANGNAYEIADIYGLEGLASPSGSLLDANAELVNNIDATGTANWNGGAGFVPIGNTSAAYSGVFDGRGNTVNGLYINTSSTETDTGLFGMNTTGSTIKNVGVTNVQVTGGYEVGGLIGDNEGAVVNAYATGTVSGISDSDNAGGLVGINDGTITDAHSSTAVNGSADTDIGGLVGFSAGPIIRVYSTGPVSGNGSVDVGGVVGDLRSTLDVAYNSGAVSDTNSSYLNLGGLVGFTAGATISDSFNVGSVTTSVGGTDAYVGGLIGYVLATVNNTYTTGTVTSTGMATYVGGFAGDNGGTISNSFWTTDTGGTGFVSGVGSDTVPNSTPGVTAATSADLRSESFILAHSPASPTFDFTGTWTTDGGTVTPQLIALPPSGQSPIIPGSTAGTLPTVASNAVNDALFTVVEWPIFEPIPNVNVIGGAGGVAADHDAAFDVALEKRLARKYGNARAEELLTIIENDRKDGSTVNTGTVAPKWASNTGLSKLLLVDEATELSQGLTSSQFNSPLVLNLFQQQNASAVRSRLTQAASGGGR